MMKGLIAGVLIAAAIVACRSAPGLPVGYAERDEILTLWTQIRDWRVKAGIRAEPAGNEINFAKDKPVENVKLVCSAEDAEVPKPCDDVCSLGDAICDNAERICTLAGKLGKDDRFGQEKCTSAKASCREASKRCCDCVAKEKAAEATP